MPKVNNTSKRRKTQKLKVAETNFSCFVLLKDIFKNIKTERQEDDEESVRLQNATDSNGKTAMGFDIKEEKEQEEVVFSFDSDIDEAKSIIVKEEEKFGGEPISSEETPNKNAGETSSISKHQYQQTVSTKI